ncbi:MAG TPA: peroxiredoxin family protein, partial [Planctomycetia bacterium]|nr:peroxiredoxin family protein [Planctomycetia bacterium]
YWAVVVIMLSGGLAGMIWCLVQVLRPPSPRADLVAGVRRILLADKGAPLSEPLAEILKAAPTFAVRTQPHPLLDKPAPGFVLKGVDGKELRLAEALAKGPVVLVFYYGYHCDHCVSQLFALNEDLKYFRELGAEVIAASADPPELTREKYDEFRAKGGAFAFPVLSDPGNRVAESYGAFVPAAKGRQEDLQHGTFVIDRLGFVRWANLGSAPFVNVRALLGELARLEGRLPAIPRVQGGTDSG